MQQLDEVSTRAMVHEWYRLLDVHAPYEQVAPLVASDGLEMRFPEATLTTTEQFREWYEGVVRRFFDEIHEMKELDVAIEGNQAEVKLVVNWQARIWDPPEAKSKWLGFDAYQTWIVVPSPETGKPVIKTYIVDKLDPMPGSSSL
jgi:hypothetical protein